MAIKLNHTIIWSRDKRESANFLTEILGLPEPVPFGPFLGVQLDNEVTLDFGENSGKIGTQHYAFLITEADFDAAFRRIKERNLPYWADPGQKQKSEIYTHNGGRGLYFQDPSGHLLEILTRPYSD